MASSPDPFRFHHPVEVRFRDIDVGGHAHHSQALIYVEEARWRYWEEVAGRKGVDSVDYIMAEVRLRYHRRVLYPGRLSVGVRTASIGRKHFEMEYEVRSGEGDLLVSAWSTQVMYDYEAGGSTSVPDELRNRIEAFEGRALPNRRQG
jgi:acyl-CoA thioester hydrolase